MISKIRKFVEFTYSKTFFIFITSFVFYVFLDEYLLNVGDNVPFINIIGGLSLALIYFFLIYVLKYILNISGTSTVDVPPEMAAQPKRFVVVSFLMMTLLTFVFVFGYYFLIPNNNGAKTFYYMSQPCYQAMIAPIMEELMFRYLLYDCWARNKLGRVKGALLIGLIFILLHPITSFNIFIVYWVPVIFLFLFYEQFGLYGAIAAHMIYNILAL